MKLQHSWGLALAIALTSFSGFAADPPTPGVPPTPSAENTAPGAKVSAPVTEVIKLAHSGVTDEVVVAYIENSIATYNLTPDNIIYLHTAGLSSTDIAAMIRHDRVLREHSAAYENGGNPTAPVSTLPPPDQPPPMPPPAQPDNYPPQPQSDNSGYDAGASQSAGYFYNALSPYGSWSSLPGYGACWQPSIAASTSGWTPYCDGGQWFFTNCGWYWNSYYPWGWAPFHYGRWLHHPQSGWLWFPGKTWGSSWVTWRSSPDFTGWAPLPPGSNFDSRGGMRFHGNRVDNNFAFNLRPNEFTFVPTTDFGAFNLRPFRARLVPNQVISDTSVVNNFVPGPNSLMFNNGLDVNTVAAQSRNPIIRANLNDAASLTSVKFSPSRSAQPASLRIFRPQFTGQPQLFNPVPPAFSQAPILDTLNSGLFQPPTTFSGRPAPLFSNQNQTQSRTFHFPRPNFIPQQSGTQLAPANRSFGPFFNGGSAPHAGPAISSGGHR